MRRTIALALALLICLYLCACGSRNIAEITNIEETSIVTEETISEPDSIELVLGETYSLPLFDVTITGFDFTEKATFPEGGSFTVTPKAGYVTANLYYDVKYTAKAALDSSWLTPGFLYYDDGYSFILEKFYYYDASFDSWLNSGTIDPLTPEFPCKACFFVPVEVSENAEASLYIQFDVGNKEAIYKVR